MYVVYIPTEFDVSARIIHSNWIWCMCPNYSKKVAVCGQKKKSGKLRVLSSQTITTKIVRFKFVLKHELEPERKGW